MSSGAKLRWQFVFMVLALMLVIVVWLAVLTGLFEYMNKHAN